ncbi:DUF5693 family protein [Thermotalea metallivorans]|uniref:Uncharacterized protein n=1 Tax=Thermotalea metallivorans TaxID=520762 RepID=A0A140L1M3_9FIRM|nr:DUF5693 family protein [Thermotalea metallivorans]KXG74448.1 hypothetical protein AN619_23460 [Thermotalea metallivorans]
MKRNTVLIFILVLGLIVSSMTAFERMAVESKNKTVDITIDYLELEKLAKQSGHDLQWWLEKFKDMGVRSVALNEESFETLVEAKKPIQVEMAGNVLKDLHWQENYPRVLVDYLNHGGIDEFDVVAITTSERLYHFIKDAFVHRYDLKKVKILQGDGVYVFVVDGDIKDALYTQKRTIVDREGKPFQEESVLYGSQLMRLALGLDPEKVKKIQDRGLEVLPRPYNHKGWSDKGYVNAVLEDYERLNIKPPYMVFGGKQVLGYPDALDTVKSYMEKNGIQVGLVESMVQREHIEQKGLEELTRALNYDGIRVFSVPPYIQKRFKYYNYEGAEEIENTLYRAITERNIRLIYFRPFMEDDRVYVTDVREYEKMFSRLKARIAEHGMTLGQASTMAPLKLKTVKKILMGWGIAAGTVLLLSYFTSMKNPVKYGLLGLGIMGTTSMAFVLPSWADKLLALGAAIVFPSLSMIYFCSRCRQYYENNKPHQGFLETIGIGVKDLLTTSAISFIGALFVGTVLSDIEYLLEMDIFRGVKLAQLLPIFIFCMIYMMFFGYKRDDLKGKNQGLSLDDVKRLLLDDIKVIYVLTAGILLAAGYVYIARTGHETNIQPSNLEMMGRNFLEMTLMARPRTKEFFIAFPALLVGVYAARKRYKTLMFISGIAGIIGQTSIVNTFSHLRTPMYLSMIRTAYALGFGILLGIFYLAMLKAAEKLLRSVRGEKTPWRKL